MSEHLRLDNQLCFAVHAAARAMNAAYQPLLEALGITYPQYLVLLILWEEDGARVSRTSRVSRSKGVPGKSPAARVRFVRAAASTLASRSRPLTAAKGGDGSVL